MSEKIWDPPLSLSTGALANEQSCEMNVYPRLAFLPKALKELPGEVGKVMGVELHMVGNDWANKTAIMTHGTLLRVFEWIVAEKAEVSIHAPSMVDYMQKSNPDTKEAWRGIVRLCNTIPIAWVVYHSEWFDPKDYKELARRHRKDMPSETEILLENSDGRPHQKAARTADELTKIVDAQAKILIDWGHMAHAIVLGKIKPDEVERILTTHKDYIRAMHMSGVEGEHGFHHHLDDPRSRGVLELLLKNQHQLNRATVVFETPKRRGIGLVEFISRQVVLTRNPVLGLR